MVVDRTHILVLNYNGRELLEECLPSLLAACNASPVPCRLTIIDNESTDSSVAYLETHWPQVKLIREANRGLASFNAVLERLDEPVVLLLNNDVKLDANAVAPLLQAFRDHDDTFFSAPMCWTFDGRDYEGMRTRVRTRFGLVQGMSRVPGFERTIAHADLTAAAGPVQAVDRQKFLALGGYDPLYFPGRIEDLDLGFRGWMAGWKGYYVPDSVAYHRGFGSFGPAFGAKGNDRLAIRNTLLFAWKNLAGPRLWSHLAWLPVRLLRGLFARDSGFIPAFTEALARLGEALEIRRKQSVGGTGWRQTQEAFFRQFRW